MGFMRRAAGVIIRPRATLTAVLQAPAWLTTWLVILLTWAACGGLLLSTEVGQQALVDERVRVIETFGGTVTDEAYAQLQARPPLSVYFTSGNRALLAPPVTLLVAFAAWSVARLDGRRVAFVQALALVVHASVVLALGQIVATPLHYVRESLTSPVTMATLLPFVEAETLSARFFGTMDVFAVWWAGLLALSLAVMTGRPLARYAWPLTIGYVAFAAVTAAVAAMMGGA